MKYVRMALEKESPEELGYGNIRFNLSESSIADRRMGEFTVDLSDLVLLYGDHKGLPELRELVARQTAQESISASDVLLTSGAAGALFTISTSLLNSESHLVVVRPNYSTNLETPRAIGCEISYVDLSHEDGFRLDLSAVESAITSRTKLISVTCPHNPTGTVMPWTDLLALVKLAEQYDCRLLVDETYRDLTAGEPYPSAAGISPRVIAVSSVSKAYGAPGLRVGWLLTKDPDLYELFLAAKEQIGICGSIVDENLALAVLEQRDVWLRTVRAERAERLEIIQEWVVRDELIDWVRPEGGVVCFPWMKVPSTFDFDQFYSRLLAEHGTYVGPGHWFEMPRNFMRIGFSWPTVDELKAGLAAISLALRQTL